MFKNNAPNRVKSTLQSAVGVRFEVRYADLSHSGKFFRMGKKICAPCEYLVKTEQSQSLYSYERELPSAFTYQHTSHPGTFIAVRPSQLSIHRENAKKPTYDSLYQSYIEITNGKLGKNATPGKRTKQ